LGLPVAQMAGASDSGQILAAGGAVARAC